ncbi:hypothetical protein MUDAN_IGPPGNFN_03626 [Lactiplantibacillus mudanjiangensis]|nr:hypothetical protein MUDAN_IGPPGNFN_03626 [Lactiplantibacillus mudanjiangensis]
MRTEKDCIGERCLLYTSDADDEEDSVDLGGRRIIKKKKQTKKQIPLLQSDISHTILSIILSSNSI